MSRTRQLSRLFSLSMAAIAIPFSIVIGVAITVIAPWHQTATANRPSDVRHLAYGFPRTWLVQDQTGFTGQTYPQRVGVNNPRRSPTSIEPGPFFEDVALIAGCAAACLLVTADGIGLVGMSRVRATTA